jgi:hypothetical protein
MPNQRISIVEPRPNEQVNSPVLPTTILYRVSLVAQDQGTDHHHHVFLRLLTSLESTNLTIMN